LFPQPFEEIRVEADGDGLLRRRNHHTRLFPKLRIGRPRLRVALDGTPDLTVAQSVEMLFGVFSQSRWPYLHAGDEFIAGNLHLAV
jgi:hypothetical protein